MLAGIQDAQKKLSEEKPDCVITIGGNCIVSLAPFDYLHKRVEELENARKEMEKINGEGIVSQKMFRAI